jgi:hypothetical protein
MKKKILGIFVCMLLIGTVNVALADWEPGDGHKMHFPQLPDPNGWDVDFHDWWLGDDWMCSETGPVTDIHFWYSWVDDEVQDIPWISVEIYSNNPGPPSTPHELLWSRLFQDVDFIIAGPWIGDQGWYHPTSLVIEHDHQEYWQINIVDIVDPFEQEEGVIYWLVIQMPYYSFPSPAIGWKTSEDHWNDNAVFGNPGNWIPLWDPLSAVEPIDFAFVITGGDPPESDLDCDGDLGWNDVSIGDTVTGTFQVGNIGDPGSLLNWAVETTTLPAWGTNWTFTPASGTDLVAGGWTTVDVSVEAPMEKNKNFAGEIKVVNSDNSSDSCKINVILTTPRNKPFDMINFLFLRFLENHPYLFPVLRQMLGL